MRFAANSVLLAPFCIVLIGCGRVSGDASASGQAMADLQRKYDELVASVESNPVQWATEDLENIGDWEYRIETMDDGSPEAVVASLNALGDERWEVFWIEHSESGLVVFLKRSSISYLRNVPLSALSRLIPGGAGGEQ